MIPYSRFIPAPIDNFSHIHSTAIITDSTAWTKISGTFIADTTYKYLILGNFYNNANTNTSGCINVNVDEAYYYVDQVSVSADSVLPVNLRDFKALNIDNKKIQ